MPVIKKVLNSSVVLVRHESGKEFIILSKGIGYGRKPGDVVTAGDDSQMFFPVTKKESQNLLKFMEEIPEPCLEVTQEIIQYANQVLSTRLNSHLFLALADHINFAVHRMEQNLVITNKVFWEIKTFYSKEYKIGQKALEMIREKLSVQLPDEEAANIAFHIANAQHEDAQGDAMRDAKLIGLIITLVRYTMNYEPDRDSIHYSRFISHLQYFLQRFFTGKMLDADDDFLYNMCKENYPKALNCAERIRTLLLKDYNVFISNEEVAYLTVHIQRLTRDV